MTSIVELTIDQIIGIIRQWRPVFYRDKVTDEDVKELIKMIKENDK